MKVNFLVLLFIIIASHIPSISLASCLDLYEQRAELYLKRDNSYSALLEQLGGDKVYSAIGFNVAGSFAAPPYGIIGSSLFTGVVGTSMYFNGGKQITEHRRESKSVVEVYKLLRDAKIGEGPNLAKLLVQIPEDIAIDELSLAELITELDDDSVFCESNSEWDLMTYPEVENLIMEQF